MLSPEALSATPADTTVLLGDNAFASPPEAPELGRADCSATRSSSPAPAPSPAVPAPPRPTTRSRCASGCSARRRSASRPATRRPWSSPCPAGGSPPTPPRSSPGSASRGSTSSASPTSPSGPAIGLPASSLAYTETDAAGELDVANFTRRDRRHRHRHPARGGADLSRPRSRPRCATRCWSRSPSSTAASPGWRPRPRTRVADALRADLGRIQIEAPTAVTLSSDSGPVGATLVNGLDQPVTVRVEADDRRRADAERRRRARARAAARAARCASRPRPPSPASTTCASSVTTVDGAPLGSFDELPDPRGPGQRADLDHHGRRRPRALRRDRLSPARARSGPAARSRRPRREAGAEPARRAPSLQPDVVRPAGTGDAVSEQRILGRRR